MKKTIWLFTVLIILSGCKREGGQLVCTLTYNLSNTKSTELNLKSANGFASERYTQFGDFITSITPDRFIGKFLHLRLSSVFLSEWELNIDFFDNTLPIADPMRLADFSNNSTVIFTPDEVTIREDALLHYFMLICLYFYQELELPEQYEDFYGNSLQYLNFDGGQPISFDGEAICSEKIGRFVRTSHEDFTAPIFDPNWRGFDGNYPVRAHHYIFGNTDSTFVFYDDGQNERPIDNPMAQTGYIIRSNKYTPVTINRIPEGETRTIRGIMSFNTTDLIQIYAGADNIPYTSDDVFVYAPKFWERISVALEYI
jgi:hypothetical protein